MSDTSLHTLQLHGLIDRMRAGDNSACEELVRNICSRMERLARRMLRQFPGVARWEQPEDVLQSALLRLLRSLSDLRPESMRAFYGLAATQMRRELLDLARHYQGPHGHGANYSSGRFSPSESGADLRPLDPPESLNDAEELDRWAEFHKAVEELPAEEREVVGLIFYHDWTQPEVAELFQVSERTVRRRWATACEKLSAALGGQLPRE